MILEKLKTFAENEPEQKNPKYELRMSMAGDCERSMDYDALEGKKQIEFRSFLRMEMGRAIHKFLQDLVARALGDDFYDCEKELHLFLDTSRHIDILGHPDGRIRSLKATLEIKSISDNTFHLVRNQNAPLQQHIEQGNLYASVLGDENVLILYINRDTGEIEEFLFPREESLFQSTITKFKAHLSRVRDRQLAPRPYSDATAAPCWYCPYVEQCYAGFSQEIEGRGIAKVTAPSLFQATQKFIQNRSTRLLSEKVETALKKEIWQGMGLLDLKYAEIAEKEGADSIAKIAVKSGKNNNPLVDIKELK